MDSDTAFIKELRKKYEGLDLSDEQILQVANMGLTREQVIQVRKLCKKVIDGVEMICSCIMNIINSDKFQKSVKEIEKQDGGAQIKRNRKGKPLKSWEKKNFYE